MLFRPSTSAKRQVIRLPNLATPTDRAQAQWSHTLPLDFAETIPTAMCFAEGESASCASSSPGDESLTEGGGSGTLANELGRS